ncbi:MAG: hypothetical protein NVS2B8_03390 [Vulcanimicrobiaceae bacterium]
MGVFGGILLVVLIVVVAGLIAYVGDRVGHQVGRKRMTLFGLRPKYTSTIVAVGTGMAIALIATVVPLLTTPLARDAFFRLSEINRTVNDLQAQADALQKQTRETNVVVNHGDLLYQQFLIITAQESHRTQLAKLSAFFDAVVASLNSNYIPAGLKPFKGKSSDSDIGKKLDAVLVDPKVQGGLIRGPVLLVAVADQNLFPGDTIHFTFAPYADVPIFRARQPIASVEVDGGSALVPNVAYGQLASAVRDTAIERGMPVYFALPFAQPSPAEVDATRLKIKTGRGRFFITARASRDVYPHTGGVPVTFTLGRTPK